MQKNFYIDNEKFYDEMVLYLNACIKAEQEGKETPSPSNYIGSCFIKIANKFVNHRYFCGYTYRDELIGDAIENCMMAIRNFDPNRTKNPFAYFSQITYFAFRRRCIKEMDEQNKKYRLLDSYDIEDITKVYGDDEELATYINENVRKQLDNNQKVIYTPKKEKKVKEGDEGLSLLFE